MNVRKQVTAVAQSIVVRTLLTHERLTTGLAFNPLSSGFSENPYPAYDRLLKKDPFHRSRLLGGWVLARHADVNAVLRDDRFLSDQRKLPDWERFRSHALKEGLKSEREIDQQSMLFLDKPDHTRLRSLVSRAFTPRSVEALRPRIEDIIDRQLSAAVRDGRLDIMTDLAQPLPMTVIAEMLGIPTNDRDDFKRWSTAIATTLGISSDDDLRRATIAERELHAYLATIVEERRREPREDLLSALVAAEEGGDKLSLDEVFQMASLLLVAGNETTTNLIGNGMLALLQHPEQFHALAEDPSLLEGAVEELLRYDPPVQLTTRFTLEDVDLGSGRAVKKGQRVALMIGAANRDPEVFDHPNQLDITRKDNRHVGFGAGAHFCLGAPLARLEGQLAISALVRRYPTMKLARDAGVGRGNNIVLRGLRSLPAEVGS